ncbi:MAG: Ig-like domain-containing protein, partial [Terracidiphilus sp.]
MLDRLSPRALLLTGLVALALPFAGCTNPLVDSLAVSPATQSLGVGQTVQFTATGTIGHGSNHPSTTQDDTDSATWTSSTPAVASVSATGVATALTAGTTNITATMNGYTGTITASATLTVTTTSGGGGGSTPSGSVTTLTIIPSSQAVAVPSQTTQFIAIGTTSTGATENLTSQVSWSSSSSQIATIGASTGLATAQTQGTVTIIALYTSGGNTIAGTGTFTVSNGSTEKYTALTLIPSAQSVSASGQTGQLIALATSGTTGLDVD